MLSRLNGWISQLRLAWLRARGIQLGSGCAIQPAVCIRHVRARDARGSIVVGNRCEIARGTVIESWGGSVELHDSVYVGPYSTIYGHGGVTIGNNTLISMHCRILSSNHTIPPASIDIRSQPDVQLPTRIGRDVWLGAGVTVLGGVTIGDGCIVGAGAVVTKDLPPGSISHGVPAKVSGWREGAAHA